MRYLLDTNVFIYLIEKDFNQLSKDQKVILNNSNNELFVSEASYFEMSIKERLNKSQNLNIKLSELDNERKAVNVKFLRSKNDYYLGIPTVPKVLKDDKKLHGDPFDLLIISQALKEKMPVLSTDRLFPCYKGLKVIS